MGDKMKTKTACPSCGDMISIWRIMSAPTPFHLSCGSCKRNVRVQGWTIPGLIIAVILGAILSVWIFIIADIPLFLGIGLFLIAAVVLEVTVGLLIINYGTLVTSE
jgi:hypothetical protein